MRMGVRYFLAVMTLAVCPGVASATEPVQEGMLEWVLLLRRGFRNDEINVGFKTVAYYQIRQAVEEALAGRPEGAQARVTLRTKGFTSPEVDHSQTQTGLVIGPGSAVALDDQGRPDGMERVYDKGNAVIQTIPWKNGQRNGDETLFEGGKVKSVIPWVDDKIQGVRRTFHPNGKLMSEASYEKGVMTGVVRTYDPASRLIQEAAMKDGQRHGETKDFWPENGAVRRVVTYVKGDVVGVSKEFYADGKLKREVPFQKNAMHGVESSYGPDGRVSEKRYWLDGEEVSEGEFKSRFKN